MKSIAQDPVRLSHGVLCCGRGLIRSRPEACLMQSITLVPSLSATKRILKRSLNLPGLTSATWPLCRTAFASHVTDTPDHRYRGFTALHHCLASSTPSGFRSSGPSRSRTCSNREALLHHKLSVLSRTCACVSTASAYQSRRCASSCFCPFFVRYGVIFVTNSSRTIDT